jgi:cyclic lactone autoinducer peptide
MTKVKRFADISLRKVLAAAAALASLTALASTTNLCYIWFHQPQMPESVRRMGRFSD